MTSFERWVDARTGIDLALPMLKTAPAWSLFKDGCHLLAGPDRRRARRDLPGFALVLGAAMGSRSFLLRWPRKVITMALQSSPIVLTLVIAATIAHGLFALSTVTVLGAAIAALGLANGSNAGQAIGEAVEPARRRRPRRSVRPRAESRGDPDRGLPDQRRQGHADRSFIGAPERC